MNQLNHVAIIMDGNGRWGLNRNKSRNFGHLNGLRSVETVIKESINQKISFLTLYNIECSTKITGLFSLIADLNKPKASTAFDGATTFNPGTEAYHPSKLCE